jgi:hypothetical protein
MVFIFGEVNNMKIMLKSSTISNFNNPETEMLLLGNVNILLSTDEYLELFKSFKKKETPFKGQIIFSLE